MSERDAKRLAELMGGRPHHTGGGYWVVLWTTSINRLLQFGNMGVAVYQNIHHYRAGVEYTEFIDWSPEEDETDGLA